MQTNEYYNQKYREIIEPLYGSRTNFPMNDLSNVVPHEYSIAERVDMTNRVVYSIDPEGCKDADDAFSIFDDDDSGKLWLAIHIADPTEFINVRSALWTDIANRVSTRYPSNTKPIHMMPEDIMEKSSLMPNQYGNVKMAITILTEINKETFEPTGNISLSYTNIRVSQTHALSYKRASELVEEDTVLQIGLKISDALMRIRGTKTRGVVLNDLEKSYIKYKNNEPYLHCDTPNEKAMKQMIAEFAIFSNSFVGEYMKIHFEGVGLYRICNASDWLRTVYDGISGAELLNEIIVNGIRAEYIAKVGSHDLVGAPEYCHMTSPIRRVSDCICHYLLKHIHLKHTHVPFTNAELEKYSNECMRVSKAMKNVQYKDTKFRLIQVMHCALMNEQKINIGYFVSGYTGLFLNIIIDRINEHSVYLSYTLRIPNLQKSYEIKERKSLNITRVNCMSAFDQGSISELDAEWCHGATSPLRF